MKVPNCESAIVPEPKIIDYLLSETHPVGKFKARVFRACGYNESNWHLLEEGLLSIVSCEDVAREEATGHGVKYTVDGAVETPAGRSLPLRTVWIIETGTVAPRFVTAFPA